MDAEKLLLGTQIRTEMSGDFDNNVQEKGKDLCIETDQMNTRKKISGEDHREDLRIISVGFVENISSGSVGIVHRVIALLCRKKRKRGRRNEISKKMSGVRKLFRST